MLAKPTSIGRSNFTKGNGAGPHRGRQHRITRHFTSKVGITRYTNGRIGMILGQVVTGGGRRGHSSSGTKGGNRGQSSWNVFVLSLRRFSSCSTSTVFLPTVVGPGSSTSIFFKSVSPAVSPTYVAAAQSRDLEVSSGSGLADGATQPSFHSSLVFS